MQKAIGFLADFRYFRLFITFLIKRVMKIALFVFIYKCFMEYGELNKKS